MNRPWSVCLRLAAFLALFLTVIFWHGEAKAANITLVWEDTSTNEEGFKIERSNNGTFTKIATVGANVNSYIDTGLVEGATYCYSVRAFNAAGNSSYSNQACGTVRPRSTITAIPLNTITIEAETGSLTAPMVIRSDSQAFGGQYVEVPNGTGSNQNDATFGGPGQANFSINIPQSGTYALWARTIAPSTGSDSFYVTRNNATTLIKEWFVPVSTAWQWNKVANISYTAGAHTLQFRQREDGTKLDQIILTSDLNLILGNNQAPAVSAGPNQTITLSNVATGAATVKAETSTSRSLIGIFRPGTGEWFIDGNGNVGPFGESHELPVVGDWDGTGITRIGVFDPITLLWKLDLDGDARWDDSVDLLLGPFGNPGDLPVVGDWDGTGITKIGVFRPSTGKWFIDRNSNGLWDGCQVDACGRFGGALFPLVGDWDGTGITRIGVFDPTRLLWKLDLDGDMQWDNRVDLLLGPFGNPGDLPVVGDWDGTGITRIGVFRPSTGEWFIDRNGNGLWDGCRVDGCLGSFGQEGDLPVVGKW